MRLLVIGSGGREHALAWKLAHSPLATAVYVAPGNDGMRDVATVIPVADEAGWTSLIAEHHIDLVVVGPEGPLAGGLADRLRARGCAVFGPGAAAARLEGDKAFAKEFMRAAGVPTAQARAFDDLQQALRHVDGLDAPCVVKATGLAAGKGVTVCDDPAQARAAVRESLQERAFGDAGRTILIEERLCGRELSVFALLDGERCCWLLPSRDHKRLEDGDRGPNTGGMGAYAPVSDATPQLMGKVVAEVLEPTLAELRRRSLDYRGLLYVGLMLTARGPQVLEYNCRFGDPETQAVLPTLDFDLLPLLWGAARGELPAQGELRSRGAAVCVVLAAEGYPASPVKGRPITGIEQAAAQALVFHAGTRQDGGRCVTAGGRVLCVVGTAANVPAARRRARSAAEHIRFEGMQMRHDIARDEEIAQDENLSGDEGIPGNEDPDHEEEDRP
jgi:phosphoribosylamine--glycine ligase